jgi:hypothetical protein
MEFELRLMKRLLSIFVGCIAFFAATGQGYVDQERVYNLINGQVTHVNILNKPTWHLYEYKDHVDGNKLGNWGEFLAHVDSLPGHHQEMKRYIVELSNRVTGDNFKNGMILLIPDSFPHDFKAYSPYPFTYPAADTIPKLFILDKLTQTFGAYEYGKLVRWGLVSSGRDDELTPPGRYNFNWKDEHRFSNAAPPGEVWEMFYVFNFQSKWGVHVHQYALPIGRPASHGCVRMALADAIWNYYWANEWQHEKGRLVRNGTPVVVLHSNPDGKAAHWKIKDGKVISLVELPVNLADIPEGIYSSISNRVPWLSGW